MCWTCRQPSLFRDLKLNPGAQTARGAPPWLPVPSSVCLCVFPQFAVEKLTELEHWKQELQDEAHTLIDFFCEDKETMKLDECLQIFRDFCVKFNKAVQVWLMASPCFLSGVDFYFSSSRPGPLPLAERWFSISTVSGKSGAGSTAGL